DKLDRGADYNFYGATTLILASSEKTNPHRKEDCACALENMFLAATSVGVGSVWINQLKNICDIPSVRAILDEVKLPENHAVFGVAALGYFDDFEDNRVKRQDNVEWIM
nr:nitroreductase family protein [Clostridiales bacterium]